MGGWGEVGGEKTPRVCGPAAFAWRVVGFVVG